MARLEGEKKSLLPIIMLIAALAAAGFGAYALMNRGGTPADVSAPSTSTEMMPGDGTAENNVDNTATDNAATDNAVTDNAVTDNAATDNMATDNMATDNAMSDNSVTDNTATDNTATMDNSASGTMPADNTATGSAAMGNTATSSNEAGSKMSTTSSSTTTTQAKPIAAREKTIKNDKTQTTVTYRKEQLADGTVNRTKTESKTP